MLKHVTDIYLAFEAATHSVAKGLLNIAADDEHHFAEAGAARVKNGVIEHGFTPGPTGSICFKPP